MWSVCVCVCVSAMLSTRLDSRQHHFRDHTMSAREFIIGTCNFYDAQAPANHIWIVRQVGGAKRLRAEGELVVAWRGFVCSEQKTCLLSVRPTPHLRVAEKLEVSHSFETIQNPQFLSFHGSTLYLVRSVVGLFGVVCCLFLPYSFANGLPSVSRQIRLQSS
jgi:hypothetical protein